MSREPRGLGKGLSALLGDTAGVEQLRQPVGYVNKEIASPNTVPNSSDIFRIPVGLVEPNPYQPRLSFDQTSLEELASSIRTLGLIQPITVRRLAPNRYQIISGERRFKACSMAGMTTIPAYVREANDQGMLEMAIVENVQRENLDPIELAMSYQRLIEECSLTQDEMAERVGKKRTTVANTLRLLKLPAKVQHDVKLGILSAGHAKAILGVDDPEVQEHLCDVAVRDGLSVRQLEDLVRNILSGDQTREESGKKPSEVQLPQVHSLLQKHLGRYFPSGVRVRRSENGKGSMTIRFTSDKEVIDFLKILEDGQF